MAKQASSKRSSQRVGSGNCVVIDAAGSKRQIRFDSPKRLVAEFARLFPNLVPQPAPNPNTSSPYLRFGKRGSSRKGSGAQAEIRKFSDHLEDAFNGVRRLTQPYDLDQGLLTKLSDLQAHFLERGTAAIRERLEGNTLT